MMSVPQVTLDIPLRRLTLVSGACPYLVLALPTPTVARKVGPLTVSH